jgi:pilus assembly protein CpaB
MKRRLVIIVLALILAAVGTGGILSYVRGANARAIAGMKAVSVLVAQKKITAGTTASSALRSGLLASQTMPASAVPADALSAIPSALSALTLSADLEPGQLLLRPMLVTAAQTTSGLAIPPGMMALTLAFCLPEVVAGAVQSGSQVAVFDTVGNATISAQPGCSGSHGEVTGSIKTRVVLTRVQVLSAGVASATAGATTSNASALSGSSSTSGGGGTLVTLAVTQAQAEQLIQMTETGMPYLALLTSNSRTTSDAGHLLAVNPAPSPTPSPIVTFPLVIPSTVPTAPVPAPVPTTASPAPAPSPAPTQTGHKAEVRR